MRFLTGSHPQAQVHPLSLNPYDLLLSEHSPRFRPALEADHICYASQIYLFR